MVMNQFRKGAEFNDYAIVGWSEIKISFPNRCIILFCKVEKVNPKIKTKKEPTKTLSYKPMRPQPSSNLSQESLNCARNLRNPPPPPPSVNLQSSQLFLFLFFLVPMESDAEDTKSQMTQNPSTPQTHRHKKKKKKIPTVQATIQVVPDIPEKTPPLVGYFPCSFDPTKSSYSNSTDVGLFRDSKKPRRLQIVVTPNGTNVDFVGTNYTGEATTGQSCNFALGVLDKATQTLKILPVASNKIFRLQPMVRGYNYSAKEPESSVKEQLTGEEKAEKQMELQSRYGTKKAIREEALESTESQISRHIPPFNESATTPQEAYSLDKIILTGEWDLLGDIYEHFQGGAEVSWDAFPRFVCHRIHKLQDIEVDEEKFKLSCIFSYITHLIKFKDQHSMDGISSSRTHRIPNLLFHKFSTMFPTESKSLSNEKTNLLISYVLVLTLFVDEFETDLTDIAKDLRMSAIALRKHYENLGCKLVRKRNVMFATLPVPLQFPQLRQRRQKRNR
ncbi:DNA-binding protein [Prunus dulcis]|uniref:DNA-binding protein n=1 Tax=Prunus dulcis TaxID=3755 RepID=A0A4Y1R474_PRUDU|nr:DNA-binding protein [Prunus dulcis]